MTHRLDRHRDSFPLRTCVQELSPKAALVVVKRLQLPANDGRRFLGSVIEARRRKNAERIGRAIEAPDLRPKPVNIEPAVYESVLKVRSLALLELTFTETFRADPDWIAERIGVSPLDAKQMIETLLGQGLLREDEGRLTNANLHMTAIKTAETDRTRQLLQEEILDEARSSLRTVPFEKRAHYAMTMAIDPAKLQWACQCIHEFIERMNDHLSAAPQTEVYQLAVQLFPLTRPERTDSD